MTKKTMFTVALTICVIMAMSLVINTISTKRSLDAMGSVFTDQYEGDVLVNRSLDVKALGNDKTWVSEIIDVGAFTIEMFLAGEEPDNWIGNLLKLAEVEELGYSSEYQNRLQTLVCPDTTTIEIHKDGKRYRVIVDSYILKPMGIMEKFTV